MARLAFRINPIITKEMRRQVRNSRAFWVLTGYLIILSLVAWGIYRIATSIASNPWGPPPAAIIGPSLFFGLSFFELFFVALATPATTVGAISGESDRLTLDTLLSTPLRSGGIVRGKLFASIVYILLLILATIPISSIVFLFGGVSIGDVAKVLFLLVVVAITFGTMGLFFSALTKRTGRAGIFSYFIILLLIVGTLFVWVVMGINRNMPAPYHIMYVNPISAMASVLAQPGSINGGGITAPFAILGGVPEPWMMGEDGYEPPHRPLWHFTTGIYLSATLLMYLATVQLVKPIRRWRFDRGERLMVVVVLVAFIAVLTILFATNWGAADWINQIPQPFEA